MTDVLVLGAEVTLDSTNNVIALDEGGVVASATIAAGTYFIIGDGTSDDLLAAIKTALDAAFAGGNTYSVAISRNINPAQRAASITITRTAGATAFRVRWLTAPTTFDVGLLGFAVEKGAADANPEEGTLTAAGVWIPSDRHEDLIPRAQWVRAAQEMASGDKDFVRRTARGKRRRLLIRRCDGRRVWEDTISADPRRSFERFVDLCGDGRRIDVHETSISSGFTLSALSTSTRKGAVGGWKLDEPTGDDFEPERARTGMDHWNFDIELAGYVAP